MIYKMDVWHKHDAQGTVTQELFCLSDMHGVEALRPADALTMNMKDQEQRAHLVAAAQKMQETSWTQETSWIVEDPFALSPASHKGAADYIAVYKPVAFAQPAGQQPILLHFLQDMLLGAIQAGAAAQNNNVINIEYRQQRIVNHIFYTALGQLINSGSPILKPFYKNINTLYGSDLREIAQEFDAALARVREYAQQDYIQNNPALVNYYKKVIAQAEQSEQFVALLRAYNYKYWDLAGAVSPAVLSVLVNAFLVWDLELVDAHAIHALSMVHETEKAGVQNADAKKVCAKKIYVVMGGVHIAAISELLPALGYTKVNTVGADSLSASEYARRAELLSELYGVEQLVPKAGSLSLAQRVWRVLFGRKNILATDLIIDTAKLQEFNALNLKFAHVSPIDNSCFDMLAHAAPHTK